MNHVVFITSLLATGLLLVSITLQYMRELTCQVTHRIIYSLFFSLFGRVILLRPYLHAVGFWPDESLWQKVEHYKRTCVGKQWNERLLHESSEEGNAGKKNCCCCLQVCTPKCQNKINPIIRTTRASGRPFFLIDLGSMYGAAFRESDPTNQSHLKCVISEKMRVRRHQALARRACGSGFKLSLDGF